MKRILTGVLQAVLMLSVMMGVLAMPAMAEENIKVVLNGTELTFDVPPQLIEDRTMVPMRKIFEAFGAKIDWDDSTQTITATKETSVITMQIDNPVITVDGEKVTLDVPPQLVNDRTLVPVRAVAEGLDAAVDWNDETQTVTITKPDSPAVSDQPSKPARSPEQGKLSGFGNDGIAELQFNARYLFEQRLLPETVFEYEADTISYIKDGNVSKMKENILGIWDLAAANVIADDAVLSGENIDTEDEAALWKLADERRQSFGLGDQHIKNVTIENIDGSTKAVIVEMLDTTWTPLSTYIAIAYNKNAGLKCFTLEKSIGFADDGNTPYMFCFVEGENRGSYYSIKNDKQAFLDAVKDVMNSSTAPVDPSASENSMVDGVKCTLKATLTVMDFGNGNTVDLGEGTPATAGISLFNDQGENITSDYYFGKITISRGSETVRGNIDSKQDAADHAYKFISKWKAGEYADVTVEVKDASGKMIELRADNVKIWNMEESLQNLLGPGIKVELN